LNDINTYAIVKKDPSLSIEKKWNGEKYIFKTLLRLRSSNSLLPKTYNLPKIHKKNMPLRIIVSSVTTLYPFAKFLSKIISDNVPRMVNQIKNNYELYNALSNKFIPDTYILVSFDVVSLFTNVPLNLAIKSMANKWELIEMFY